MRRLTAALGAAALTLGATVALAGPVSAQDAGSYAYTTVYDDEAGGCRLAVIDLETAEVIEAPTDASSDACVADLAVAADGTVWGLGGGNQVTSSFEPAAPVGIDLVRFDDESGAVADTTPIDFPEAENGFLAEGGIAIDAAGTVWVQAVTDSCADADEVCLWTVDPSTGVASAVGGSGELETELYWLADCAGELTSVLDGEVSGTVGTVSKATGEFDPTSSTAFNAGFDCTPGSSSGYAIGTPAPGSAGPQATDAVLYAFDTATGELDYIEALDPELDVQALAMVVLPTPPPSTTSTTAAPSTTTTAAAQPAVVTPRFTG